MVVIEWKWRTNDHIFILSTKSFCISHLHLERIQFPGSQHIQYVGLCLELFSQTLAFHAIHWFVKKCAVMTQKQNQFRHLTSSTPSPIELEITRRHGFISNCESNRIILTRPISIIIKLTQPDTTWITWRSKRDINNGGEQTSEQVILSFISVAHSCAQQVQVQRWSLYSCKRYYHSHYNQTGQI